MTDNIPEAESTPPQEDELKRLYTIFDFIDGRKKGSIKISRQEVNTVYAYILNKAKFIIKQYTDNEKKPPQQLLNAQNTINKFSDYLDQNLPDKDNKNAFYLANNGTVIIWHDIDKNTGSYFSIPNVLNGSVIEGSNPEKGGFHGRRENFSDMLSSLQIQNIQ